MDMFLKNKDWQCIENEWEANFHLAEINESDFFCDTDLKFGVQLQYNYRFMALITIHADIYAILE